jgi:hypothetical protein
VTIKRYCSAFQDTDLLEKLKAAGVEEVVIGGMQTEFCVDTAVRGAFERGLGVTLITDGHTTFDTPAIEAAQIIAHHNHTLESGHFAKLAKGGDVVFSRWVVLFPWVAQRPKWRRAIIDRRRIPQLRRSI